MTMGDKKPVDETKVLARVVKDIESLAQEERARVLMYLIRRFTDQKDFVVNTGTQ